MDARVRGEEPEPPRLRRTLPDGGTEGLPLEEVFQILADRRRRYALYSLNARDDPLSIAELARDVTAMERRASADDPPDDHLERVTIDLHHVHLPRLHRAKLLEYDHRQGDVVPGDSFRAVEKYLELAAGDEGISVG